MKLLCSYNQGCGNAMPELSDLVPFHSEQVKISIYLKDKYNKINLQQFCISTFYYYEFTLKTLWILISWLFTVYKRVDIWFHTVFKRVNCLSTERHMYRLICSFGQEIIFFGQVHYSHLLVPGQVENFTISTPLLLLSVLFTLYKLLNYSHSSDAS